MLTYENDHSYGANLSEQDMLAASQIDRLEHEKNGRIDLTTRSAEELLRDYLNATDNAESQWLLGQLVSEHAEPVIREFVKERLQTCLYFASQEERQAAAEEIYGETLVDLLEELRELKTRNDVDGFGSFRDLVVERALFRNTEFLRKRQSERWRLRSRIRYILTHRDDLAIWESMDNRLWCGFSDWDQHGTLVASEERLRQLLQNPKIHFDCWLISGSFEKRLEECITRILKWVSGPIEIDLLVEIVSQEQGFGCAPGSELDSKLEAQDRADCGSAPLLTDLATEANQNALLRNYWEEICCLPQRQRAVLLLSLRDHQGNDLLLSLPVAGVATVRQITETLGLPEPKFLEFWNDLPLDDVTIAECLGLERDQVSLLRSLARERLARKVFASSRVCDSMEEWNA